MKNIHRINGNIFITNDEEIKDCYVLTDLDFIIKVDKSNDELWHNFNCKKITLTTDIDLIEDGIQPIDDEFLEWFIQNPNYEEIKVLDLYGKNLTLNKDGFYKIVIPKEEPKPIHQKIIDIVGGENKFREIAKIKPKQETLEDFIKKFLDKWFIASYQDAFAMRDCIKAGAKWQKEQEDNMYSEEEVIVLIDLLKQTTEYEVLQSFRDKVEQFKKK